VWWYTPVIPATWEAEIRKIEVPMPARGGGGAGLARPHLNKQAGHGGTTFIIQVTWDHSPRSGPGKNVRP
jgi:hypothetical protein